MEFSDQENERMTTAPNSTRILLRLCSAGILITALLAAWLLPSAARGDEAFARSREYDLTGLL